MYDTGDESVRLLCFGDIKDLGSHPLLRIHSSCLASEVFGALDCDCADQLRESIKLIASEGRGLIIHLHQEGRGQGLSSKIKAIQKMQQERLSTVEAFDALGLDQDARTYEKALTILHELEVRSVRLITNNPRKVSYLESHGIHVEMVNTHPRIRAENAEYLRTKKTKLGHLLPLENEDSPVAPIRFYHSDQPWGELSNFSRHAVFLQGKVWPTVEHFYQAQKFAETSHEETIRCCPTPMRAKSLAREFGKKYRRHDWAKIKEDVMLEGLRAKFEQHPDLRDKLLSSEDRILVEHTDQDVYWGDGGTHGKGRNRLGQLLMQIRSEISKRSSSGAQTN